MKKIILFFIILIPFLGYTQIVDDFEDGDITDWTQSISEHWAASNTLPINGVYSLRQNYDNSASGKDQISLPISGIDISAGTTTWQFQIKHNTDPTSGNNWSCFLIADSDALQMFPTGVVNGYAVGVNFSGNDNIFYLWKITNGVASVVINTNFNWLDQLTPSMKIGVKVTRSISGEWSVFLDIDNNGILDSFTQYGSTTTDNSFTTANHFGFYYLYSAANDLKFWADDVSITGASGNNNDSQISAGSTSEPLTISSLTNSANGIMAFDVNFSDLGTSDGLATIINQIQFTQGSANEVTDWTNAIAGAKLIGPDLASGLVGTVNSSNITFSGTDIISIAEGGNETYGLYIWLKTDLFLISDNDNFEFMLDYNDVHCNFAGSSFGSGVIESGDNNNSISIVATKLNFSSIPSFVALTVPFSLTIQATDANNNIDLDATNSVTLSKATGTGNLTASEGLTRTLVAGEYSWTTLQYNIVENFSIFANTSGLTAITSSVIECVESIFYLKDDFEDGDLIGWTQSELDHWEVSNLDPLNGTYSLKQKYDLTTSGTYPNDIISHPITDADLSGETKYWRFQLKYLISDPSSNNFWNVFLMTDNDHTQMVSGGNINGYLVGVDFNSSDDLIKLQEITNGTPSDVIVTAFDWKTTEETLPKGFEVSRTSAGDWEIKIDEDGGFDNLLTLGTGTNSTHTTANYFGISYKYSSSNDLKFTFDDVYFGPEIPDTEKPTIVNVTAVSNNRLQILFSEEVTSATSENTSNYLVNNTIENPISATLNSPDNRLVELQFDNQFTESTEYSITIQNIEDLSSNILETAAFNFSYSKIKVNNVSVLSANAINVYFSQDVDNITAETITNYSINNAIGNPFIASVDVSDNKLVHLSFTSSLELETEYTLTVQNVEDIYGNSIDLTEFDLFYYVVQKADVVINELMIDINPLPVALPGYKYIEIFNNSNYDINLANWTIAIGTNTAKTFPDFNLKAYEYAIICDDEAASELELYGDIIPIITESQLTSTSGKQIVIKDNTGNIIDDITYSTLWYNDDIKEEGGWSLERIDPDNICNQDENWMASLNYIGGTPGRINSVFGNNPDIKAPYIVDIEFYSARSIIVEFSEIVNTETALNFVNYIINDSFTAFSGYVDESDGSILYLTFAENFNFGANTISISNITDYCNNIMNDFTQSFNYELIHPVAIEVKSKNQAIVYFSEDASKDISQNLSNYYVNNSIDYPIIAMRDANDSSKVHLQFENNFTEDSYYTMSFYNITDIHGNAIVNTDLTFSYHIPKQFDIVVNELMLDINPSPVGLPAQQYVELYNTTNFDIWLSNWTFKAESQSERTFPTVNIPAKSYAIIVREGYELEFDDYENVIPLLSSSDLTQSGKNLVINDNLSNLIYSLDYSAEWYQDEDKDDGGWSLEKIDPLNFCGEKSNWKASNAAAGGTPCEINSIYAENPDNVSPELLTVKVISSNHILVQFNENISIASKFDTLNYFIDNSIGYPSEIMADDTSHAVVHLYFENQFTDLIENTIMIQGISDDCGNTIENTSFKFTYYLIHPESLWVQNSKQIQLKFSEVVDYISGTDITNYTVNNSIGNPAYAVRNAADQTIIYLQFTHDFVEGQTNTLSISNINDINGNTMKSVDFEFTYYLAQPNDIVVNEVLFNPTSGGYDYVELYNRSNYQIDLRDIRIGTRDANTKEIESVYNITDFNRVFAPQTYLVLTEDTAILKIDYTTKGTLIQMSTMPSFPDDEGTVLILDANDSIVDEFNYSADMHFALLSDDEGVSLERVDFEQPTNSSSNWQSAAENAGFGTPGYENSQYKSAADVVADNEFTLEPEVFSPDNDGYDDVLNIHYQFNEPGYVATIKIYDSKGRHVRDLVDNELLSVKGILSWDGLDEGSEKVKIGIYIVFIEIFDIEGNVKYFKKTCVVATKVN